MSDPNTMPALDDDADGDQLAGALVDPEHDLDVSTFTPEADDE